MSRARTALIASAAIFILATVGWIAFLITSLTGTALDRDTLGNAVTTLDTVTRTSSQSDGSADLVQPPVGLKLSGPAPAPSPTPFPGNAVVNVTPGNGTLAAAVNARGGNTTYFLASGTYTVDITQSSPAFTLQSGMQFIGKGDGTTIVQGVTTSQTTPYAIFEGGFAGNQLQNIQLWGMTIDKQSCEGYHFDGFVLNNILIQNCHIINYVSKVPGHEGFPIAAYGNYITVDSCRFTPSSQTVNQDGITVVGLGDAAGTTGNVVSNCLFDTPTDTGTLYYHCVGLTNRIFNCHFTAPSFGSGEFCGAEPGSGTPIGAPFCTLTGNKVILANNWHFVSVIAHPVMNAHWMPGYDIENNTITNGVVFRFQASGGIGSRPQIDSVTITNNTISNSIITNLDPGCSVGTLITSPNH